MGTGMLNLGFFRDSKAKASQFFLATAGCCAQSPEENYFSRRPAERKYLLLTNEGSCSFAVRCVVRSTSMANEPDHDERVQSLPLSILHTLKNST
jgi:hypothetical protein